MRKTLACFIVLAGMLASSCITSDIPLLTPDMAQDLPLLEGEWQYVDPEDPVKVVVTKNPDGPGYKVENPDSPEVLDMLVMPLEGDFYLAALDPEGESPVTTILKMEQDMIHVLVMHENHDVTRAAMQELGVDTGWAEFQEFGLHFTGPDRETILRVLARAASAAPLDPMAAYSRITR